MSNKRTKLIVEYPRYDISGQLDFLHSICEGIDFDVKHLIPLIFAEWICTFQECYSHQKNKDVMKIFIPFLQNSRKTYDKLKEIEKYVREQEKNNDSSH